MVKRRINNLSHRSPHPAATASDLSRRERFDRATIRSSCWQRVTGNAFLLVILFLTAAGCSHTEPPAESSEQAAKTEVTRGPVRVVVEVAPHPARLSDEPTLTLTIDHEQGVDVEKPPFGEAVGDFIVRDFREPLPKVKGDREIVQQIYTLEPTTTGALQIDPIPVVFTDNREHGDGQQHVLETEALTVNVLSMVDDKAPTLDDLEGYAPPVELPASRWWLRWLAVAGGILLPAVGVGIWLLLRRKSVSPEEQLTPQEIAQRELQRLRSDNLGQHDVKTFYVELTGIVRRYIEATTGVHAPEQTTEEFLREIGGGETFGREARQRLQEFLESADLVKFAAHRPATEDIEDAYHRARRFVGLEANEEAVA